jgi:hypothetical protein
MNIVPSQFSKAHNLMVMSSLHEAKKEGVFGFHRIQLISAS